MAFASTQDPTNTDEERELDERFVSTGMHVDVDVDVDVDADVGVHAGIAEQSNPFKDDVREVHSGKRPRNMTSPKLKKSCKKGDRLSEMTEAINNFSHISERRIESREARHAAKYGTMGCHSTGSTGYVAPKPILVDDEYNLGRALQFLDTYTELPHEKFLKVMHALYQLENRVAFLTLSAERREAWMEFAGQQ